MIVNKIIKAKDNKYKIVIDDNYIVTYDNVILENDLLYKKNIDKNLYDKIISDTIYYDIYNKVVKFIMKRRRSEKKIHRYLNKFELDTAKKNSIVKKLKKINLINDKEFAKAYINDKIYLGKDGINKIKNDLIKEDISVDIIDSILKEFDTTILNNNLEKIIIKKIKSNTKYSSSYLKNKILYDMINRGYNKEEILKIIEKNMTVDSSILEREFNKIYNNLKIKYSGGELRNKVKQKMTSKGFEMSEINLLLQQKTEN